MSSWILTLIIFSPLAGAVLLLLPRRTDEALIRRGAMVFSLITLVLALAALYAFETTPSQAADSSSGFQMTADVPWISAAGERSTAIDIGYKVGVDGISIWLIMLTAFLTPLAIWSSFTAIRTRVREYYILLLLLEVGLLGVFCAMDLLLFYVFFEFTLIPLYFLIGIWGGPERRRAANKFFLFTLVGSVLTFAGVVYLGYFAFTATGGRLTLDIEELTRLGQTGRIPFNVQWWMFLAFAAGFAIKVPLFPVHTWLPLAHTEAPTAGSVILAGVLLKLGTYGFCRLSIPMLPDATFALAPTVAMISIIGIIYASLAAWVQDDVKKLVAYSSVAHLGFCMLGMFSLKVAGMTGGVMYMINHGLSTGALFLVVGCVYERYHTRDIHQIGGLARKMPWMAFFLVFFTLSSIGLPGLNGFVGEFLVLLGTATSASTRDLLPAGPLGYGYVIPAALGIILGAVYMLWMCRRVLFGPLKEPPHTPDMSTGLTRDLTRREIGILTPIALACIVLGVYPGPMLSDFETAVREHILRTPTMSFHTEIDATATPPTVGAGMPVVPAAWDEVNSPTGTMSKKVVQLPAPLRSKNKTGIAGEGSGEVLSRQRTPLSPPLVRGEERRRYVSGNDTSMDDRIASCATWEDQAMSLGDCLVQLAPEWILLVGACAVLVTGLARSSSPRGLSTPLLALVVVIGAFAASLLLGEPRHGAAVVPGLWLTSITFYTRCIALGIGGLILLVNWHQPVAEERGEYMAMILFSLLGVLLTASANDLIVLFFAIELVSIPTYVLIALSREDARSSEASVKYFFLGALAAAILAYGLSFLYGAAGTTTIHAIEGGVASTTWPTGPQLDSLTIIGLLLVFGGLAFKVAAVPFHVYAPDVYEGAASPVTGLLGFVPKLAGFVALIKVGSACNWDLPVALMWVIWTVAVLTMTVGNVLALLQNNAKRILAYSSIAHTGYMLIAFLIGPVAGQGPMRDGIAALLFYIAVYGAMNLGVFAVLSAYRRDGRAIETLDDLCGLALRAPMAALALAICVFSLMGFPPTAGFLGKLYIFASAFSLESSHPFRNPVIALAIIGVLNSAIAAAYYLRIVAAAYIGAPGGKLKRQAGRPLRWGLALCAVPMLVLFAWPGGLSNQAQRATTALRAAIVPGGTRITSAAEPHGASLTKQDCPVAARPATPSSHD